MNSTLLNGTGGDDAGEKQLCNLAEGYSFVLQSLLGVLAFSTLIRECLAIVSWVDGY